VLDVGGILAVYERSTTETQSARRTHREKKRKLWVGITRMLFFCVGIIDMMIITTGLRTATTGQARIKEIQGKFQVLKILLYFFLVSVRSL